MLQRLGLWFYQSNSLILFCSPFHFSTLNHLMLVLVLKKLLAKFSSIFAWPLNHLVLSVLWVWAWLIQPTNNRQTKQTINSNSISYLTFFMLTCITRYSLKLFWLKLYLIYFNQNNANNFWETLTFFLRIFLMSNFISYNLIIYC